MGKLMGPLFSVIGVGMLWLAYLSATERLKRNGTVGMRTKATMASHAAWYAAHRASAWSVASEGLIFLGVGIWLLVTQPDETGARTAVLGSAIAILVVIVIGGIQADRVAKGVLG
jgi:hypothetical protein